MAATSAIVSSINPLIQHIIRDSDRDIERLSTQAFYTPIKATPDMDSTYDGPLDPARTTTSFDRFRDLPTELRYQVYEQHFLDDSSAITTREWPLLRLHVDPARRKLPFLPAVCFVSKDIHTEAVSALMHVATLKIAPRIKSKQTVFRVGDTSKDHAIRQVRKIRLVDFNDLSGSKIIKGATLPDICKSRARKSNAINSVLLGQFKHLTEVTMHFHAATHTSPFLPRASRTHALSIDKYLASLNMGVLLRQQGIQKITLLGKASYYIMRKQAGAQRIYLGSLQDDTVENLMPLLDLGKRMKEEFKRKGREVQIQVCLSHKGQRDEIRL
jgi:hypothetical protein